jgi:hypothetical protein
VCGPYRSVIFVCLRAVLPPTPRCLTRDSQASPFCNSVLMLSFRDNLGISLGFLLRGLKNWTMEQSVRPIVALGGTSCKLYYIQCSCVQVTGLLDVTLHAL